MSEKAEKEYKAHAKKVEDYKKFNRLDEYKNYQGVLIFKQPLQK